MDHFQHKHQHQDSIFNDFDTIFTDNTKRDLINEEIVDNDVDSVAAPSRMSPFVNLGGGGSVASNNIFFDSPQVPSMAEFFKKAKMTPVSETVNSGSNFFNQPVPAFQQPPQSPVPAQPFQPTIVQHIPAPQQFSAPPSPPLRSSSPVSAPVSRSSVSIKPFTFFSHLSPAVSLPQQSTALPQQQPQPFQPLPQHEQPLAPAVPVVQQQSVPAVPVVPAVPEVRLFAESVGVEGDVRAPAVDVFSFPTRDQDQNTESRDNDAVTTLGDNMTGDNSFSPISPGLTPRVVQHINNH